jgi:hypothetical protein
MRALSIRQPYAELILRGIKRIEFRSRPTRILGERFHIYASKKPAGSGGQRSEIRSQRSDDAEDASSPSLTSDLRPLTSDLRPLTSAPWSRDLSMAQHQLPPWMVELANGLRLFPHELPTGVIVGSAVIERVSQREDGMWQWHLIGVERAKRLRKPTGHPQPVWFTPF